MRKQFTIDLVAAARPNFMKIAPLWHALAKRPWARARVIHTGQHYDYAMSQVFFEELGLPTPYANLGVGSGSHGQQTGRVLEAYEAHLVKDAPDLVVVVGDVNATPAAALAAVKLHIPTAHLEAGLRSFDRTMPEEINRLVTDTICDHLWTPSEDADMNLASEGIPGTRVTRVGNIMIDTLLMLLPRIQKEDILEKLGLWGKGYAVVTLHRPSNVDSQESLKLLCELLLQAAQKIPLVFPLHPRTRARLEEYGLMNALSGKEAIRLLEPQPYCAFMSVKAAFEGSSRHTWPAALARYDGKILRSPKYRPEAEVQAYFQYRFDQAWRKMIEHAHARGIQIIGDIPMYVSDDSADVWEHPELFMLDEDGRPSGIAGAPPDGFAPQGQVWGNPTYRWDVMRKDNYQWWTKRLERACSLYDYVRLDHFLGFHNYFCIPAGEPGSKGRWLIGPGKELFDRIHDKLGDLPFIGEDLGVLTPGVRSLVATCGFPGMDVLEFSDYNVLDGLHPHESKVFYTSTHDTAPLVGFCERSFAGGDRTHAQALSTNLITNALQTDADVVMMPLQDVLGLGDEARMNVPGVADGNWTWQAAEEAILRAEARTAQLLHDTGRFFPGEARSGA